MTIEQPLSETKADRSAARLGTFGGVFTPSILTILGIILFLRLGFVTGEAGLGRALLIIGLANVISVLTSFSLAAIATNFEVKGGGDYYLISRSLGPQYGGAIGIILFLAQSISVAFYAIGFGEAVAAMVGVDWLSPRVVAGVAVAALFVLAWLGSDWATRFQYGIMAFLFLGLLAFTLGALRSWNPDTLAGNWVAGGDTPFWILFALFFPAVTGFTQGVSMSGELRSPARSLPLGTFLAVGVSVLIYFGAAVLFAGSSSSVFLTTDYGAMRRIAFAPWLIDAGVIAATLSSALASFLGAPRILQSLAADRLVRPLAFFAKGAGPNDNPRRGVALSGVIAAVTVFLGDLDVVAPVVSMFFLISYGLLNYATYFEARSKSPSFRPSFRFYNERLSLVGCLVCAGAIIAINPTAGAISFAALMAIHQFLGHTAGKTKWADSSRSSLFQGVRRSLLSMSEAPEHARDWRPVILAFSDDPTRRERIMRFASWIEGGSGLTTVTRILTGEGIRLRKERERAEIALAREIREHGLEAFARVVVVPDIASGFQVLLQSSGLGPIRANTVLLSWFDQERFGREDAPAMASFGSYLRTALRHGCNAIVLEATLAEINTIERTRARKRRIDVWWHDDASSRLALMLAYLMRRTEVWQNASLRVLVLAGPNEDLEARRRGLEAMLQEVRIDAEPRIVRGLDSAPIVAESSDASLVMLPFRLRNEELLDSFGQPFGSVLEDLPVVALVLAAQDIDLEAQPDEGLRAEIATALEQAVEAEARLKTVEREVEAANHALEKRQAELEKSRTKDAPPEELAALEARLDEAVAQVERDRRRLAKAQAKAHLARQEADALAGVKAAASEG